MTSNLKKWKICCGTAIVVSILTFTPLVTPHGVIGPMLLGMPRTLWAGILITVVLVALTLVGAAVHPGDPEGIRERRNIRRGAAIDD